MNYTDCRVYGKTPLLKRIFQSKRGWVVLHKSIDLTMFDRSVEEE